MPQYFYPSGAEAGIFQDGKSITMAADALAACVTRPSAAVVIELAGSVDLWQLSVQNCEKMQTYIHVPWIKFRTTWLYP